MDALWSKLEYQRNITPGLILPLVARVWQKCQKLSTLEQWQSLTMVLHIVACKWAIRRHLSNCPQEKCLSWWCISHLSLVIDNRLSFTEWYGSSLPGCRSTPFVWYAVQTMSEIVTHWPARCPSVAMFNCWRPVVCCGWCSIMEQSATWCRCMRHTVTLVPSGTQNIIISTVIYSILMMVEVDDTCKVL